MNFILDITRLTRRRLKNQTLTGIDRVSIAYVNHFKNIARALVRFCGINIVLSAKDSQQLFAWLIKPNNKIYLELMLLKNIFRKNIIPNSILINTGHIGIKQKNYLQMIKKYNLKPIFFVHDLIPINYPEYCSPGEDLRLINKLNYIFNHGVGIITNSYDTLAQLNRFLSKSPTNSEVCKSTQQFASQVGFQTESSKYCDITLPAIAALIAPNKDALTENITNSKPYQKPYFVMLSTIEPRKNHLLILQIFRNLANNYPNNAPHLFIIGKRGWECEQVCDLLDRSISLRKVVTEITNCEDNQLVSYLKHSCALLFPSFAEGFGLPLIEALTIGTPVIASNLEVFKEIAGEIPEYIDPLDAKAWQNMILDYADKDSIRRNKQLNLLKNFKSPTWEEHFLKVEQFLTQICNTTLSDPPHILNLGKRSVLSAY